MRELPIFFLCVALSLSSCETRTIAYSENHKETSTLVDFKRFGILGFVHLCEQYYYANNRKVPRKLAEIDDWVNSSASLKEELAEVKSAIRILRIQKNGPASCIVTYESNNRNTQGTAQINFVKKGISSSIIKGRTIMSNHGLGSKKSSEANPRLKQEP